MRANAFLLTLPLVLCGASVVEPTDDPPKADLFAFGAARTAVDAPVVVANR